jgi:alanine-glyoxylate transaminase/serine-glyoxylate transaminase/serine-pyruvate transaminase
MARSSRAVSRLKLFKDHLEPPSLFELNTPFSTERSSRLFHEAEIQSSNLRPYSTQRSVTKEKEKPAKMSTQEAHPALLIPGPIEFDDAVLQAMSHFR